MTQITESAPSVVDAPALTAADRCDSCGAQAYVRVTLANGELMFCAHHGKKYQEKLAAVASNWHDESARLSEARA
ncbi:MULTISPECIES: DUF7455 domain-containing protein [Mycetocola]|uniref:DUF7455 domain-containing protein n=1 Tax=Mycetocola lacteus TaxID=76637 RepID=A0A3L7ANY0_9MICO|nr:MULTISPECIES: hypothetical protein [Mycetocola]MCS4276125.1 hypothetical protein [Mycetocola sp. BIGb0189]RLP82126.1 hypothetical protein D9V34_09925 [Mycetocola lacteus]